MTEWLANVLLGAFKNERIATLVVSVFPLIELKGAIPIGKGLFGLGLMETAGLAYLGSTAAGILVFFLLKPVFALLKKIKGVQKLVLKTEAIFEGKAKNIEKKSEIFLHQKILFLKIIS